MKKIIRVCAGIAVASMLAFVASCANPADSGTSGGGDTPTLAETVVDELVASLEADAGVNASMGRAVSSARLALIKAAALAKIQADGYTDSQELDKILPSMMEGVKAAVAADTTLTSDATKADLFAACAKGALSSLGKEGRQSKISADVTDVGAAASVVTASVVKVAVQVVTDTATISATIKTVTTASVTVMQTNAVIKAVSSEETIAKTVAKTMEAVSLVADAPIVTAALVEAVVAGVSETEDDEAAKTALVKIVVKAAIEADSTAVTIVVKAAATAVAADATADTATAAATMIAELAKQAAASAAEAGEDVTAAELAGAAGEGVTEGADDGVTVDTTEVETEVEAVVTEVAPVITEVIASVAGEPVTESVTVAGTVVTLAVTATPTTGVTYAWTQVSGPSVLAITGATGSSATVTPNKTGTYEFKVTVKNADGYKSASGTVTVSANFASVASKAEYDAGMSAMAARKWDEAYTKFLASYAADNTNTDAKAMAAFLKLAHISVDPGVVSLMKDRIGLLDYPTSINTLFSKQWMNRDWYEKEWWSETNDGGETWTDHINYYLTPMPELDVPTWATSLFKEGDLIDVDKDGNLDYPEYRFGDLLALNILSRNPNGLNAVVDAVLAGAYGDNLTSVLSLIDSLPATASVTIPANVLSALGMPPSDGSPIENGIAIHKAELKLLSSTLKVSKSFVQLLASYNLNYPLAFMQKPIWVAESGDAALADLIAQKTPFELGFMSERSEANRLAAKATMLGAISDFDQALVLSVGDLDDETSLSAMGAGLASMLMEGLTVDQIKAFLGDARSYVAQVSSVIENNSAVYVSLAMAVKAEPDFPAPAPAPSIMLDEGSEPSSPMSSMMGIPVVDISLEPLDGYIEAHPAAFYATDILNPAKLLEMNEAGTGMNLYVVTEDISGNDVYTPLGEATVGESIDLAVKVNFNRVGELADIAMMMKNVGEDGYGYVHLPPHMPPKYLPVAEWLAQDTEPAQ